jgi:hypothetical protein
MRTAQGLRTRVGIAGELFAFLWQRKLWWMIPMVMVLLAVGGLMLTAHSSALAPFIYPFF